MKTVKIINGAYGQRAGGKLRVVRLGEECQVDDQEAARLVGLHIAAYTEEEPEKPAKAKKSGKPKPDDSAPPDLTPEGPVESFPEGSGIGTLPSEKV